MMQNPPGLGVTIARGAGWGALLGGVCGLVLPTVTELALEGFTTARPLVLLYIGLYSSVIGLLYGLVAGAISALAIWPLLGRVGPNPWGRLVGALAPALVVILVSWLWFHPSLEVGPNETQDHVRERVALFYLVPGGLAIVAGLWTAPRLFRPARPEVSDGEAGRALI